MRSDSYSAAGVQREYAIPPVFLRFGEKNLIAVRVFDLRGCGGIADVPVGIYSHSEFSKLLIQDFSGTWKFAVGDSTHWARTDYNGVRIGRTGSFNPSELIPHGTFILHWERFYFIPPHLIRGDEKNVIAVRIYDVWRTGGIWDGPVGITTREAYLEYMKSRNKK